ncbi:MAG: flagellar biosynthesis protein FliQ [Gemmatimonadota bacterium]
MSYALVTDLARNALMVTVLIAAPLLIVALLVGLLVSIVQTVTQVQEQTLSFLPKLVAVGVTFIIALPWMLQLLVQYTTSLLRGLPAFVS